MIITIYKSTPSVLNASVILHESLRMPKGLDLSDRKRSFKNLLEKTKCFILLYTEFEDTVSSNFAKARLTLAPAHYVLQNKNYFAKSFGGFVIKKSFVQYMWIQHYSLCKIIAVRKHCFSLLILILSDTDFPVLVSQ